MVDLNQAFEEELYFNFLKDPESVSEEWRNYFSSVNGKSVIARPAATNGSSSGTTSVALDNSTPNADKVDEDKLMELPNIPTKIAQNMEESLTVPTATSVRNIPVKPLDENRKIINKYLLRQRRSKISFSYLMLWAIVQSLKKYPSLNDSFVKKNGKYFRQINKEINLGVAVDIEKKTGERLLLVPNLKNAGALNFSEFIEKLSDLINRAKNSKITLDELEGTTISLTNPGMIGTIMSVPRLMNGQGMIIASGSIDFPAEFSAVKPEKLTEMAVSKVVSLTNTYDHRIIQGAESAEFLRYLHQLLIGEHRFYDQIFASLRIPFNPVKWEIDTLDKNSSETNHKQKKSTHVMSLINSYRSRGHLLANVNPLGMTSYSYPELDMSHYGLNIWDLDRHFPSVDTWSEDEMTLREILELMRDTYCGSIGIEFSNIQDLSKKNWIKNTLESSRNSIDFSKDEKKNILKKLIQSETFEDFLHKKFIGQKRFSLEGAESLIVMIDQLLQDSANSNTEEAILGMAHRGRLNVLVNNAGKSLKTIFNEFAGEISPQEYYGSGDVKYHLGQTNEYTSLKNNKMKVTLTPNPSHLEVVNPVVGGLSRALIDERFDDEYTKVLPILVHGDAAFAGQGIVQEVLNLSRLEGYSTGGTIHIIVNNQIGFTTTTEDARSTYYASDVAKMLQVPILHVNGHDPEAVAQASIFALNYRNKYGEDVIIDLLCYRKYGHNEGDEPSYTQPLMYKKIRSMESVRQVYEDELIKSGVLTKEEIENLTQSYLKELETAFDEREEKPKSQKLIFEEKFGQSIKNYETTISKDIVEKIIDATTSVPDNFNANPKVISGLMKRRKMIESDKPAIDWATAETLAFGAILLENKNIRFTGEDTRRGTFSQRHAVLIDKETEQAFIPLNNMESEQATIHIYDSPLSELAVVGYDYGYSVNAQNSLTLWEAQFGDFVNMAQPIIDQFISCGEVKWGQTSNLIMLLPHGHDGQGPEHSSARLERFLQLCAEENMIVGNFTTPANYFHALRRHSKFDHKIPMILMTPKSMLRHSLAVSSVEDFTSGQFQHIIDEIDDINTPENIKRVVLVTGKLYYDILQKRRKEELEDIAIIRIEQLYPMNITKLEAVLNKYSNAEKIVWSQEEPQNQGAWNYMLTELLQIIDDHKKIEYAGRHSAASTSTGSAKVHNHEQSYVVNKALGLEN
ncbi:MAG: multifunctional oxoglutarate decarboxylase/oxoglutarate dehydrogenase thiamine pyrophosphate-binding subunit/dihydrolipoyllysine-residue succinyltransferase subunit [Chlorobiota bacterium]